MYTKSNSFLLQSKLATLSYKIMMNAYSCMFVKIGRINKPIFYYYYRYS